MQRYQRFLPLLALAGAWFLFFWRFAAPGDRVMYPPGDFTFQFGAFRDVGYRAVVAGRFPLWVNCLDAGYPFHADPQAQVFYPPLWLTFGVLRLGGWGHFPIEALIAEVAFHYLFLSVFLYLFLRSRALRRPAALLGALVFTYGGYLTGSPPLQTATLEVNTWLPLVLLFTGRFAETRRRHHLALTALMLGLAFLAGHPQTFVYVALLALAYFTFRAWEMRWPFRSLVIGLAGLIGLTAALAAVQLIPSAHFILSSTRASVDFEQAAHGFPFQDILQFFLTGFVSYWHPLYVGLLPLGLAAFALTRPGGEVRFWAGAALVSLILSFGAKGVAYEVAYWLVPGYRLFREQERLALVVSFSLAVLAAFGAHHLFGPLARSVRRRLTRFQSAGRFFFATSLALLALFTYLARLGFDPSDWRQLPNRAGVMVLGSGLTLVALTLRTHAPASRRWLPAVFVSVGILDLFAANRPLNMVPAYQAFPYIPLLDPIASEPGFFRVQDDAQLPGHAGCSYGYQAVEGITPYRVMTYSDFNKAVSETARWQLLGVRFLVTWRQAVDSAEELKLKPEEVMQAPSAPGAPNAAGITKVFRLSANAPRRAFLVHSVHFLPNDVAIYAAMSAPNFEPFATVFVNESKFADLHTESLPQGVLDQDTIAVVHDVPGHVTLKVRTESPGLLILSEAWFPGWTAHVDGVATPVLRADGALLGVELGEGDQLVTFTYRPPLFILSAIISGLALLLTLWWLRNGLGG